MTRKSYQPTEKERRQALSLAAWGRTEAQIAEFLELAPMTLRKHFAEELARGRLMRREHIEDRLTEQAIEKGNVGAIKLALRKMWAEDGEADPFALQRRRPAGK